MNKSIQICIDLVPIKSEERPLVLRQEWLNGCDEQGEYSLSCGAGVGNPLMHIQVGHVFYTLDMSEFLGKVIEQTRK